MSSLQFSHPPPFTSLSSMFYLFRPHKWSCCLPEAQVQSTPCRSPSSSPKVLLVRWLRSHATRRAHQSIANLVEYDAIIEHIYVDVEMIMICYRLEISSRLVACSQPDGLDWLPARRPGEENRSINNAFFHVEESRPGKGKTFAFIDGEDLHFLLLFFPKY